MRQQRGNGAALDLQALAPPDRAAIPMPPARYWLVDKVWTFERIGTGRWIVAVVERWSEGAAKHVRAWETTTRPTAALARAAGMAGLVPRWSIGPIDYVADTLPVMTFTPLVRDRLAGRKMMPTPRKSRRNRWHPDAQGGI